MKIHHKISNPTTLQSILFSKRKFKTKERVLKNLQRHNKNKTNKLKTEIVEEKNYFHVRQRSPNDFIASSFKTKKVSSGVSIIIGHLK